MHRLVPLSMIRSMANCTRRGFRLLFCFSPAFVVLCVSRFRVLHAMHVTRSSCICGACHLFAPLILCTLHGIWTGSPRPPLAVSRTARDLRLHLFSGASVLMWLFLDGASAGRSPTLIQMLRHDASSWTARMLRLRVCMWAVWSLTCLFDRFSASSQDDVCPATDSWHRCLRSHHAQRQLNELALAHGLA